MIGIGRFFNVYVNFVSVRYIHVYELGKSWGLCLGMDRYGNYILWDKFMIRNIR